MKKTLLAAALIAGFAGVANAETSVTLYGIVDTGIAYEQVKGKNGVGAGRVSEKATRTGLKDGGLSGNRWGLKGSEDLGNGLRANFRLESGFSLSNGDSKQGERLFGRWATVGLSGDDWGSLDFGRQDNVASRYFVDAYGTGNWDTGAVVAFGETVDGFRLSNAVVYQTPNFEGFQAAVGYSFNADNEQEYKLKGQKDQNNSGLTTGLRYANGPVEVAATYDRIRLQSAPNTWKHASAWTLSGAYDFEVVKLSLAFGQSFDGFQAQDGDFDANYHKKADYNNYAVSLAAPVGDGTLSGTYNLSQPRKEAKTRLGTSFEGIALDSGDKTKAEKQHNFGLAYNYPLSKRTTVYAIGGYTKNFDHVKNAKRTVVGAGLRHAF